jgi:hypothetical protein
MIMDFGSWPRSGPGMAGNAVTKLARNRGGGITRPRRLRPCRRLRRRPRQWRGPRRLRRGCGSGGLARRRCIGIGRRRRLGRGLALRWLDRRRRQGGALLCRGSGRQLCGRRLCRLRFGPRSRRLGRRRFGRSRGGINLSFGRPVALHHIRGHARRDTRDALGKQRLALARERLFVPRLNVIEEVATGNQGRRNCQDPGNHPSGKRSGHRFRAGSREPQRASP